MTGQFLSRTWQRAKPAAAVRLGRLVMAALAVLALAGCTFGLVYPRLDSLASWQLDRYFRLESGQERWLDERLEERLGWHQREQLPQWRAALAGLRAEIAEGRLDAERHQYYSELTNTLLKASMAGLVDDTVQLAGTLTDAQVKHVLDHFDEETEELKQELAERADDPSAADRDRYDGLVDDVEQWLGSVSEAQQAYLQQWQRQAIRWGDYALDSRQRWREFMVASLATRTDPVATRRAVETMFLTPAELRSPAYQAAVLQQSEHRRALHLYLLQSMTAEQKQHLLGEIDSYLEDLDELLADPV